MPDAIARIVENKAVVVMYGADLVRNLTADGLAAIGTANDNALAAIDTAETNALSAISTSRSGALADIGTAETNALAAIGTAETDALAAINPLVDKAEQWAEEAEDVEVETGQYSAKHHSAKASAQRVLAETAADEADADRIQTGLDRAATTQHVIDAAGYAGAALASQNAAETAEDGAVAAEAGTIAAISGAGGTLGTVTLQAATRVILAGLDASLGLSAMLLESGREGMFEWDSSDLSAMVTIDTEEGIYVAPTTDATGASGAWVRVHDGRLYANWFGCTPATDSLAKLDCAHDVADALGGAVIVLNAMYDVSASWAITGDSITAEGQGWHTGIQPTADDMVFGLPNGVINVGGDANVIRNMKVDARSSQTGDATPFRSSCIKFQVGSTNGLVENVFVRRAARHGIGLIGYGHKVIDCKGELTAQYGLEVGDGDVANNVTGDIEVIRWNFTTSYNSAAIEINDGVDGVLIDGGKMVDCGYAIILIRDHAVAGGNQSNRNIKILNVVGNNDIAVYPNAPDGTVGSGFGPGGISIEGGANAANGNYAANILIANCDITAPTTLNIQGDVRNVDAASGNKWTHSAITTTSANQLYGMRVARLSGLATAPSNIKIGGTLIGSMSIAVADNVDLSGMVFRDATHGSSSNITSGVDCSTVTRLKLRGTRVINSVTVGLRLNTCTNVDAAGLEISGSGSHGLSLVDTTGFSARGGIITGNQHQGVRSSGGDVIDLSNMRIENNGIDNATAANSDGIFFTGTAPVKLVIKNTVISKGTGNLRNGMTLLAGTTQAVIGENIITGHTGSSRSGTPGAPSILTADIAVP